MDFASRTHSIYLIIMSKYIITTFTHTKLCSVRIFCVFYWIWCEHHVPLILARFFSPARGFFVVSLVQSDVLRIYVWKSVLKWQKLRAILLGKCCCFCWPSFLHTTSFPPPRLFPSPSLFVVLRSLLFLPLPAFYLPLAHFSLSLLKISPFIQKYRIYDGAWEPS